MINTKDYELIWIFFQWNFKRFQAWELINLWKNYYFEKEERKEEIRYKLKKNHEKSFDFVLNNSIKDLNVDFNIKAIIWNNGAWKSTILDIIKSYYKNQNKLKVFSNRSDDNIFDFKNINKKVFIYDYNSENNLVLLTSNNIDILFLVKPLLEFNEKIIININQSELLKKQNYNNFISNDNSFNFLRDKILIAILKITDDSNNINIISKLKLYSTETFSKRSKIILVSKFLILRNLLLRCNNKWYFYFNVSEKLINDLHSLSLYHLNKDIKSEIKAFLISLKYIDSIIKEENFMLSYIISIYLLYRNIIIGNDLLSKIIFNVNNEKFPEYIIESLFWNWDLILNDKLINRFSPLKYFDYEILDQKLESIFDMYVKNKWKWDFFSDTNLDTNMNILRSNRRIINNIERIFWYHKDINLENSINFKKSYILNKTWYWYIDINYDEFKEYIGINVLSKPEYDEIMKYFDDELEFDILIKDNDNEYYLSDLSSWEKQIIWIFNILNEYKSKNWFINIIIDEPEISLHLEWQRKFIYYLLDWINLIFWGNRKINLYIATHSPFIISDLEKNDVIFLHRDYKNKTYVKSFDEIKNESNLIIDNTFIANIPELIRWPFFLDDVYWELGKEFINNININDYEKAQKLVWDKFLLKYLLLNKSKND